MRSIPWAIGLVKVQNQKMASSNRKSTITLAILFPIIVAQILTSSSTKKGPCMETATTSLCSTRITGKFRMNRNRDGSTLGRMGPRPLPLEIPCNIYTHTHTKYLDTEITSSFADVSVSISISITFWDC